MSFRKKGGLVVVRTLMVRLDRGKPKKTGISSWGKTDLQGCEVPKIRWRHRHFLGFHTVLDNCGAIATFASRFRALRFINRLSAIVSVFFSIFYLPTERAGTLPNLPLYNNVSLLAIPVRQLRARATSKFRCERCAGRPAPCPTIIPIFTTVLSCSRHSSRSRIDLER